MSQPNKLSVEFLRASNMNFRPKTEREAELLQRYFLRMGMQWQDGTVGIQKISACLERGFNVDKSKFYATHDSNAINVDVAQLPKIASDELLSDKELIIKLRGQVKGLRAEVKDLHGKVDRLLAVLEPRDIGKPLISVQTKKGLMP